MWSWGRPKRDLPVIDYAESSSSEEDYESGLKFDSPLQSPQRPIHTREGSPSGHVEGGPTLADNVDDTLEEVQFKLHDIAVVREEIEEVTDLLETADTKVDIKTSQIVGDEVEESGFVTEQPQVQNQAPPVQEAEANMPDDNEVEVDFEDENGADDDKALEFSRSLKLEYDPLEVAFYFIQLENEMFTCGVKSQWLKRSILVKNLPPKIQADVKSLLILKKSEAPTDLYKQIKTEILRIHAPK